ncbi:MAG TPA: 16S rRNA (adenine(1518)-N(6)/adenine(1519)-N(6))-dimethyltransferase RsmA, partial [Flavitalea sp.]|nr:16S rRNA (adenine(1518)-N(6)/adenine(1519)-N(6))-dimethyltransferase RsmA [Flavitalea sp.]
EVIARIVAALRKHPFSKLLEIGPGGGALTRHLVQLKGVDFKCVEIDEEKVSWILSMFPVLKGRIIHQDFLTMEQPFNEPFTIIGNFPYNISTQIVFRILDWKDIVETTIGMFQKEVAERIAAREGSKIYGVISVLVQAFFDVEYLFEVEQEAFRPPPKVKSAVIRLTPRSKPMEMKSERAFQVLVKTAFNQRRKTLRNAVRSLFDPVQLENKLFNLRAEQLSVEQFAALTFKMK